MLGQLGAVYKHAGVALSSENVEKRNELRFLNGSVEPTFTLDIGNLKSEIYLTAECPIQNLGLQRTA